MRVNAVIERLTDYVSLDDAIRRVADAESCSYQDAARLIGVVVQSEMPRIAWMFVGQIGPMADTKNNNLIKGLVLARLSQVIEWGEPTAQSGKHAIFDGGLVPSDEGEIEIHSVDTYRLTGFSLSSLSQAFSNLGLTFPQTKENTPKPEAAPVPIIHGKTFGLLKKAIEEFPSKYQDYAQKMPKLDDDIRVWLKELKYSDRECHVFGAIIQEHFSILADTHNVHK